MVKRLPRGVNINTFMRLPGGAEKSYFSLRGTGYAGFGGKGRTSTTGLDSWLALQSSAFNMGYYATRRQISGGGTYWEINNPGSLR